MSAGRDEEKPETPPTPEGGRSPTGLLTSQDIFGEILDGLAVTVTPPPAAPLPPARGGPIKVQISESLAKGKPRPAPTPPPETLLPEDMARLLDAFSEPETAAATTPPAADAVPSPSEVLPEGGQEPPVGEAEPAPFAGPALDEPELDEPTLDEPTLDEPALDEPELDDPELDEMAALLEDASRLLGRDRRGHTGPQEREALDDLMQLRLPKDLRRQGEEAARMAPPSRPATRFQVIPPKAQSSGGLDLGALAEEAMREADEGQARAAASDVLGPGSTFGPYRLLHREATGGMAEVWRAKRSGVEGFEKVVAVKRILPHLSDNKEFVEMFVDEAKMVAGLAHPNIVQIFDLGRIERSYFIAMEYVHGHDLRSILKRARERGMRLPLDLCVLIASRVCLALEFAHRKRDETGQPMMIVHRDVSPQNILISFEGEVKLTDFGIAKAASKASITDAGALRGKLLYMSPEQAWGKAIDRRSDLFSLGLVLYEMVADQRPFTGASEMSILETVRQCQIPPPSSANPRIPERLDATVVKALQREPDYRYQDAGEMYRDLERVLHERQPLPADALAHFMRTVFELEDKAEGGPEGEPAPEPAPRPNQDMELSFEEDAEDEMLAAEAAEEAAPDEAPGAGARPGKDALSIQKLLRKFGIK
jgi:hypothetical protein